MIIPRSTRLITIITTAMPGSSSSAFLSRAGSSPATEPMMRELTAVPTQRRPNGPGRPPRLSAHALLGVIALVGLVLIGLSALRLADTAALVSVPTAMFLCVYLTCTASAARILSGPVRVAAAVAVLAVLAVLAFCGWTALLAVAAVAAIAAVTARRPAGALAGRADGRCGARRTSPH